MARRLVALLLALAALLPATASARPTVKDYDLGELALVQDNAAFPTVPIRLQGVVGVPEVAGAAPLVVVLHGRHPVCTTGGEVEPWPCPPGAEIRNDLGFRYLVEALAARGFLALAVNLNGAYTLGAGEPPNEGLGRVDEIVAAHVSRLATASRGGANAFGTALTGRLDVTRLVLVGHSKGGEAAMYLAREHRKRKDPRPGGATDGRLPVDAALLVAPTANPATTRPQVDIPTAVVLPGCDGDVVGLDGAMYHDHARLAARRTALAASVVVQGANHNAFNTAVKADDATAVTTPGCVLGAPQRLRPKAQRAFLVDYASAFADTVLRGIVAGGLDPFVQPPAELFGATVTTSLTLPSAQRLVVLEPRSRGNLRTNALRGTVRTGGGATLAYCAPGRACAPGLLQPAFPSELRLTWTRRGGLVRLGLPPARGDLTGFDALALRAAVDPTAAQNPAGKAQAVSLALVDASGRRARVVVPASQPALRYPIGVFTPESASGSAPLGSVRVPLPLFAGVDLTRIRAIEVRADRTASGALLLANVELIAVAPPAAARVP